MRLLLDTGVLGMACHPKSHETLAFWLKRCLAHPQIEIVVPALADYELRRKLLHLSRFKNSKDARESLRRLDALIKVVEFQPLSPSALMKAAELWAEARGTGRSSAAEPALDGDVILAAQALESGGEVVTTNLKHLDRLVKAHRWEDLQEITS